MFKRARYQGGSLSREQRKSGAVWVYRWRENSPTGHRRKRKVIVGTTAQYRTESAARRAVEALRLDINQPAHSAEPMTVARLIVHYREKELGADRHSKAATTCEVYGGFIENWIKPRWGEVRLTDVRTTDVEAWLRSSLVSKGRTATPLAPGTRAKIRNIFSALFSHAVRWEFIHHNPISGPSKGTGVRQSSKRLRTPFVLTVDEIAGILSQLHPRERTIVFLAAATGLRSSELRGLQWRDIDPEGCTINLQRGVVRHHVGEMKTTGSRRPVPVSPELIAALLQLRARSAYNQPEDWVLASEHTRGKSPIWLNTVMDRHVRPAATAAGITKHISWHVFRHSFATLLKANKEDAKVVQESLRHSTVRMTMETYAQAVPEHVRAAHAKLVGQIVSATEERRMDVA